MGSAAGDKIIPGVDNEGSNELFSKLVVIGNWYWGVISDVTGRCIEAVGAVEEDGAVFVHTGTVPVETVTDCSEACGGKVPRGGTAPGDAGQQA